MGKEASLPQGSVEGLLAKVRFTRRKIKSHSSEHTKTFTHMGHHQRGTLLYPSFKTTSSHNQHHLGTGPVAGESQSCLQT